MSSGPIGTSPRGRDVPFSQRFIDTFECGHVYSYLVSYLVWLPYIPGIPSDESFIGEICRKNIPHICYKCCAAVQFSNWREQLRILNEDGNREGQTVDPNTILPSPVGSDPPSSPLMPIVDDSTPAADTGSNQRTLVIASGDFPTQEIPIRSSEGIQTLITAAPRNNIQEQSPATVTTSTPDKTQEKLSYADVLKRKPITLRPECAEASLMTETPVLQGVEPVNPPIRPRLVFRGRALASNEPSSSGVVPAEGGPGVASVGSNIPLSETSEFVEDDLSDR